MGIPSFSYHLDMYFGLSTLDRRADRVGQHWSWKVDHFFSTDGAHQARVRGPRSETHVASPGCGLWVPQRQSSAVTDFRMGFWAVSYHPEYPFRTRIVEALRKHDRPRFRVFSGLREEPLNNALASIKVVWATTASRACRNIGLTVCPKPADVGIPAHPETEGMTIPTATYKPQDIGDLIHKIDYYLAHEEERLATRDRAFEHVKNNDTYTHRLAEVLRILGL